MCVCVKKHDKLPVFQPFYPTNHRELLILFAKIHDPNFYALRCNLNREKLRVLSTPIEFLMNSNIITFKRKIRCCGQEIPANLWSDNQHNIRSALQADTIPWRTKSSPQQ